MPSNRAKLHEEAIASLQDIIAPSSIEVTRDGLKLDGKVIKTFFVISYPRFLTDGWLAPLVNLDRALDIAIHVTPIATDDLLREYRKKVAEVESQIIERREKGLVRDPMLDVAYQDLERLRDELQQSTERMFSVGLYITLYADTEAELQKAEDEIKSMFEEKLIYIKPAIFQHEFGFKTTIPLGMDTLNVTTNLNTGPLSSLFPFISSDLTQNKGILYGINRHNNSMILFDRFTQPNYNSVIFATAGAGKSFATKLEVLRSLIFDTEVMIIDPEREYEFLANAVGGRYINISLSSEHHLNPFDLPKPQEDENPSDVFRSHVISLVGLFRILLGGLTPEEDSLVDRALTETYALRDITPTTDFINKTPPLISDFEMVLDSMEGTESLLRRLNKYTQGTWSGFLNQPTNVALDNKLVVFSIRDMEEELKPAAMYIITHFIWNAVRREIKKRLLVVDEAWWMMKSEDTASFLFGIAKRCRKYYLGLATITQDVEDFLKSPYGKPIISNSSIQLLMKQAPASIELLQQTFNLTDEEKFLLLECGKGEGIFFAGNQHAAISVVASYTEEQIVTSDPSQILRIKNEQLRARSLEQERVF
ncbi:MAG TPA: conjugal transfer protein TraC [Candidatus Paceibacterota bacterium]